MRSQVRREGSRSCSWLLLCSCTAALPTLLLAAQGTTFLDGDDGGDHVSNGGTRSMLWTAKGDMTLACCAWAIVPTPSLLQPRQPVSASKQATVTTGRLRRLGRSEGLRRPFPSPACNASVIKGCLPALPACLPRDYPAPHGRPGRPGPERNGTNALAFEGAATVCDGNAQHLPLCPVSWSDGPDSLLYQKIAPLSLAF